MSPLVTQISMLDVYEKIIEVEPSILGMRAKKIESVDRERQREIDRKVAAEEAAARNRLILEDRRYWKSMILAWLGIVIGVFGFAATVYGIMITLR